MKRAWRCGVSLSAILLLATAVSTTRADEPTTVAKQDDIAAQIKVLIDGNPLQRRDAKAKLQELGKEAVEPLAKEAAEAKPVVMYECFDVLARLLASENEAASTAAKAALDKLSESENRSVALRAKSAIRIKEILGRRQAAMAAIPALPAQGPMKLNSNENGRTIELERAADGSFSGKIKEPVNGEEKTTDIKAADAKELEQKFPEAHKALQKHEEQVRKAQQNALRAANPFGGVLNANVQINGGAIGQRTSVKIVNGDRTIEVQNGDEKVEIRDKNGKEIELKHTRPVDGKAKTDEYKGADLDDLKKKHPEAAKLYEKYAPGNGIGGGAAAQIQIQAGPGGFRAINGGLRLTPTDLGPIQAGPRTIRAELDDRKIEITDEDGRKIRVKITKTLDGKDASEEFSADDLKELKAEHPDAAKLYEKFTGSKAE